MKKNTFLLIIFNVVVVFLQAQTFKGGISFGANAAQINGDRSFGYNKIGLHTGVQVSIIPVSEKKYYTTGIFYSQRGAKAKVFEKNAPWTIKLDYIEVPILYNYKDWLVEKGDKIFYRTHVGIGVTYGRLFNPKAQVGSGWEGKEDLFRKNNINIVAEATIFATKHLGFGFRYNRDLLRIYRRVDKKNPADLTLIGHFLMLRTVYIF